MAQDRCSGHDSSVMISALSNHAPQRSAALHSSLTNATTDTALLCWLDIAAMASGSKASLERGRARGGALSVLTLMMALQNR